VQAASDAANAGMRSQQKMLNRLHNLVMCGLTAARPTTPNERGFSRRRQR
jgi:hypothetical protein